MTAEQTPRCVEADSYVTLHYRIELISGPGAGAVFADTFSERPATLQMGTGQWAPGMEALLLGQPEGARARRELAAAQAYGERNPELLRWLSRAELQANAPEGSEFIPGEMIQFVSPGGARYAGVLKTIQGDDALLDFNHPLAGIDLLLEFHILGVL